MINKIPIIIDERGSVSKDITILAMENENLSKTLSILLPNSISDKWLYIEFEKADGQKFTTPRLLANGNYIAYDLGIDLLDQVGKLTCQVIAKNDSGVVWKSYKFDFSISGSINATEQVVESSPDVIADLQKQIDNIEVGGGVTSYNDLTDKPTIPAKTSELTNDSGFISSEEDPTVPSYVKSITQSDIDKWNSGGGGSSTKSIQLVEGTAVTLQPNTHTVITGVSNNLTISIAEEETTELKNYSFEFTSIDRIPKVTFTNVTAPFGFEYDRYKGYIGEIIDNKVCYKTIYDAYPYQWVYGIYANDDWTSTYTFDNQRNAKYINNSTTKNGTYSITENSSIYGIYIEYDDGTSDYISTAETGTFTSNGVVYTKS